MFVVVATIFEIVALVFLFLKQCRDTEGNRSPSFNQDMIEIPSGDDDLFDRSIIWWLMIKGFNIGSRICLVFAFVLQVLSALITVIFCIMARFNMDKVFNVWKVSWLI